MTIDAIPYPCAGKLEVVCPKVLVHFGANHFELVLCLTKEVPYKVEVRAQP